MASETQTRYLAGLDQDKEFTHKYRCPECGEQVELAKDDILVESDWTEATEVEVRSHICTNCGARNLISYRAENGVKVTYITIHPLNKPKVVKEKRTYNKRVK